MDKLLVVAVGGSLGAVLRYLTGVYAAKFLGTWLPYGTLIVNVLGSFILSFFMILFLEKLSLDPLWRMFVAVGFCGSYTTLSSITYETITMVMDGEYIKATLNVLLNFFLSFLAAVAGIVFARLVV